MIPIFLLTYNEQDFFISTYTDEFVQEHFVPNNIHFYVLDNGNQPKIHQWCEHHGYTYYASEYNIGSAGGYNWVFKTAHALGITNALFMQSDLELSSAWPLLFTYALTETFGETHFPLWPQILDIPNDGIPYQHHLLPNLGNFFGFNAQVLERKDCYFDENYVVTHFDDMEYMSYIQLTKKMQALNVSKLLPGCKQFNHVGNLRGTNHTSNAFVVQFGDEFIKVHHASQLFDNHNKWYTFNRPYFDFVFDQCQGQRQPYDPNRWQQHGYPAYPVWHEIRRFFITYPNLLVNHKFWEISNKMI